MRPLLLAALAALFSLPPAAQPVAVADLDAMFGTEAQVEVNLRGSLIRLAAQAAGPHSPETALMLDGLRSVTVRIYPVTGTGEAGAVATLSTVADQFEADGWFTMVRVRALPGSDNEDGDVWVYVREDGDTFDGLAVLAFEREDETAVFVHIDGTIRPDQIGELSRRFAKVDLDEGDDDEGDDD